MRRTIALTVAGSLVWIAIASRLVGEEGTETPKAVKKNTGNRLPKNYGKLGLTQQQKDRIYEIQGKYNPQISELEAKIKQLRSERDQMIESALTPAQRERLVELRGAGKEPTKAKKPGKTAATAQKPAGLQP